MGEEGFRLLVNGPDSSPKTSYSLRFVRVPSCSRIGFLGHFIGKWRVSLRVDL